MYLGFQQPELDPILHLHPDSRDLQVRLPSTVSVMIDVTPLSFILSSLLFPSFSPSSLSTFSSFHVNSLLSPPLPSHLFFPLGE